MRPQLALSPAAAASRAPILGIEPERPHRRAEHEEAGSHNEWRHGLLHELIPNAAVVALLANPNTPESGRMISDAQEATRSFGQQLLVLNASTPREINAAFATMRRQRAGALYVGGDPFFTSRRQQIVALANRDAIPDMYANREFVVEGGTYEPSAGLRVLTQSWHRPRRNSASQQSHGVLRCAILFPSEARKALACRHGDRMKHREFIRVLGGAAIALPLSARAQERMRLVGVLTALGEDDPEVKRWFAAFQEGLCLAPACQADMPNRSEARYRLRSNRSATTSRCDRCHEGDVC
jgi:hypothetical protein